MASKYPFTEAEYDQTVLKAQFGISTISQRVQDMRKKGMPSPELDTKLFYLQICLYILQNYSYDYYTEETDVYINALTTDQMSFVFEQVTKWSGYASNYFSAFTSVQ